MALRFGTSVLRGLVTEMTDRECYLYTLAFLRYVKTKAEPRAVVVSGDYRSSMPRIIEAAAFAAFQEGLDVDYCGFVPTPALTAYGLENRIPSIMVTGSHIPEDRNGIKYNMPWGEVLKGDEAEVLLRYRDLEREEAERSRKGTTAFEGDVRLKHGLRPALTRENPAADQNYIDRYVSFFLPGCLAGLKVVFYQHSSVSRRILPMKTHYKEGHIGKRSPDSSPPPVFRAPWLDSFAGFRRLSPTSTAG